MCAGRVMKRGDRQVEAATGTRVYREKPGAERVTWKRIVTCGPAHVSAADRRSRAPPSRSHKAAWTCASTPAYNRSVSRSGAAASMRTSRAEARAAEFAPGPRHPVVNPCRQDGRAVSCSSIALDQTGRLSPRTGRRIHGRARTVPAHACISTCMHARTHTLTCPHACWLLQAL